VLRTILEEKNVIAVVEGAGALADETIVVGAHYDCWLHLPGIPWPGQPPYDYPTILGQIRDDPLIETMPQVIRPAANDNASGVAVMLEVAREMAQVKQNPRRRMVFIAFAGEELGMVGSKSYIHHPLFPIEKTVAMINLDMVGRLQDDRLVAIGAAPPGHFSRLLDRISQTHGFRIDKAPANPWAEDQAPFHARRIPTLYFATGPDEFIHTPIDRAERLNIDGMRRIARMLTEFLTTLAADSKRPEYAEPTESK
jgi:putative aminopeptidase FrvX